MKKLFIAFLALMIMQSASFAQTAPKKSTSHAKVATTNSGVVLKKDGTPDKRYKKTSAGPVKKDGTPDKRYKANKAK